MVNFFNPTQIDPDDGVADCDFAVFWVTTDCSNLGAAIGMLE
jgi:hypothetical protein